MYKKKKKEKKTAIVCVIPFVVWTIRLLYFLQVKDEKCLRTIDEYLFVSMPQTYRRIIETMKAVYDLPPALDPISFDVIDIIVTRMADSRRS